MNWWIAIGCLLCLLLLRRYVVWTLVQREMARVSTSGTDSAENPEDTESHSLAAMFDTPEVEAYENRTAYGSTGSTTAGVSYVPAELALRSRKPTVFKGAKGKDRWHKRKGMK